MKNQGMEYQMFLQEDNSEISQKIQNIKKEELKLFEFLKVNSLNLPKIVKGILVHNGYFFVSDLMNHFKYINDQQTEKAQLIQISAKNNQDENKKNNEALKIYQVNDIKTDPKLDQEQNELIARELERVHEQHNEIMSTNPFILQFETEKLEKRKYIQLMKELVYYGDQSANAAAMEEPEDNFLDIVFGLGEVTELCGLNCTGKTQICFQLALNVQIPKSLGGVEGESLFIDTHGDFSVERVSEMAKSLRSSVLKKIDKEPSKLKQYRDDFLVERILSKIHFMRILDDSEQQLLHQMLEKVILKMQNLKLIVIDTFAEHFRATDMGYNDRKKMIANALMGLQMIANKYKICVVLVNNMKTGRKDFVAEQLAQGNQLHGVIPGGYQQPMPQAKPEPLFGQELFQWVTNRIMLERDHNSNEDNIIRAKLIKGSVGTQFTSYPNAHFQIFEKGIAPII